MGLDFTGAKEIGQAFPDAMFRVFQKAKAHPGTALLPLHMTQAMKNMFDRAMKAGQGENTTAKTERAKRV